MAVTSPATIRDVARNAQLSVASVSRALNGHTNVHPDTRARVLAAATELGYVPNAAARSLSTARSGVLGVVLPDLHGEFFSEILRGMDRAASVGGFQLLMSNMHADSVMASHAIRAMRGRVEGLVVMAPQLLSTDLAKTLPEGLPTVLVNTPDTIGYHNLRIDNASGVTTMIRHLLAAGRQAIVHISGAADNIDGRERCAAYREAMSVFAPKLPQRVFEGDFQDGAGERIVKQMLAENVPFDAIFAANDMMALGAMTALREAGLDVPGDVAVAGFDDIPLARYLSLTTMRVDMVGVGTRAIERLLAEIGGNAPTSGNEAAVPELIVRNTTGPFAP